MSKHKKPQYREKKEQRKVVSIRLEDSIKKKIRSDYGTVQNFVDKWINVRYFS